MAWVGCCAEARPQQWPDQRYLGQFVFHADFSLDAYQDQLKATADLKQQIGSKLRLSPRHEPVNLYLFHSKRTYENYIQHYFPSVPYRRALFIKQRGPGMVFAFLSQDFEEDLRHETTHAILHSVLPMVPLWLDEGLAEYFEVPAGQRAMHSPHLKAVRWNARWRRVPDLQQLESLDDLSKMKSQHYRDAWAWVHYFLHGPPAARDVLIRYLSDLQTGMPPGQLSQRLARRAADPRKSFSVHFQNWK